MIFKGPSPPKPSVILWCACMQTHPQRCICIGTCSACVWSSHACVHTWGCAPKHTTGRERGSGPAFHPAVCTWPQLCSVGCHGLRCPALTHCCSGTPMLAAGQAQTRAPHPLRLQPTAPEPACSLVPHLVHGFALCAVISRGAGGPAAGFGPPRFGTPCFPRGAGGAWLSLKHYYSPCPQPPPAPGPSGPWLLGTGGWTGDL